MGSLGTQLKLLLWKNYTLRKRQLIRLFIELLIPLTLFVILAWVKLSRGLQEDRHECHFDGKALPSAGPGPFIQSFLCTSRNHCWQNMTSTEQPGVVQNFNSSLLSQFYFEFEELLSNKSEVNAITRVLEDINTFQHLFDRSLNGSINCTFQLGSILVDPGQLQAQIRNQNISLDPDVISSLINSSLNSSQIAQILNEYYLLLSDPTAYLERLQQQINGIPQQFLEQLMGPDALLLLGSIPQLIGAGNITSLGSLNSDILALELRSRLCQNQEEYLIVLTDPQQGQRLINEICALDAIEFQELVTDIINDLDFFKLLNQMNLCSQGHGRDINYDRGTYDNHANILSDLINLESLESLLEQFNSTYAELMNAFNYNSVGSARNVTNGLAQLLCGRNEDLISIFEQQLDESDPVVDENMRDDEQPLEEKYTYDNTTTKFCNDIFRNLERTTEGRIFWKQVKPLVRGKIPYTPDSPLVREILTQANSTFAYFGTLQQFARDWLMISPNLTLFLETDTRVEFLRFLLEWADVYINNRTNADPNAPTTQELFDSLKVVLKEQIQNNVNVVLRPEIQNLISQNTDYIAGWLIAYLDNEGKQLTDQQLTQLYPLVRFLRDFLQLDENPNVYTWRNFINDTDYFMDLAQKYIGCFELNKFEPYASEFDLIETSMSYIEQYKLWAGVVFDMDKNTDALPPHIKYKIRQSVQMVDSTAKNKVVDSYWTPGPRRRPGIDIKYITYGFSYLQDMISHSIIRMQTNITDDEEIGMEVQQMPFPCYIRDNFALAISRSMPMFMVLAWIYSVAMIVKGIVYEKERRLKEVMKVMGLGNGVHWLAWFITSFIPMLVTVILLVIILKGGKMLQHSDASVVLVFMLMFLVSTIMFCFMISVFFSKANLAAASAGVLYFTSYLPYSLCTRWEEIMTASQKASASLFNTVAFSYGCSYFSRYEEQGIGIQWHNIADSPLVEDRYSMLGCIIMMMVDTIIYGLITWYVEAVFPGQFGMPRPWYFFVTKSYWCGTVYNMDDPTLGDPNMEMNNQEREKFEKEPSHLPLGVSIRHLRKVYKRGKKVAVDGLSLNFYEGQITSFLGHNGAGKTTTMSVLTGLYPPTEGTAYVYNKDIRTNMDQIRQNMGMCPQHNVLFDQLTVEEHMWFYALLKGMNSQNVSEEMNRMIKDTGLTKKKQELSRNLSGGMKRKLSIAIAFVGGSKVVILDEPTAGVDPHARRSIWELLLNYKKGRTIILSTHFMDEADILGDRIAIISQGKLCFSGSSLFLKSQLGSGYYLTLVKKDEDRITAKEQNADLNQVAIKFEIDEGSGDNKAALDDSVSEAGSFDESALTTFIQKYIPDAVLKENIGSEVTYQLPDDKQTLALFEDLFQDLDSSLEHLGISSYGISDTTLEEVFLKVAEETGVDEELPDEAKRQKLEDITDAGTLARPVTRLSFRRSKAQQYLGMKKKAMDERTLMNADGYSDSGSIAGDDAESVEVDTEITQSEIEQCNGAGRYRVQGWHLLFWQFMALLIKRFHVLLRSKKGFLAQIVMPAVFICLAQLFTKLSPAVPQEPPMEIHPWHLQPTSFDDAHLRVFYSNDDPHLEWTKKVEKLLQQKPGLGNRCMEPNQHQIEDYPCMSNINPDDLKKISSWTKEDLTMMPQNCTCEGVMVCPKNAAGPEPATKLLYSTDYLLNVTGRNISDWILKTHKENIKRRYGGLSIGERNDMVLTNRTEIEQTINRIVVAANGGVDLDAKASFPDVLTDLELLIANFATKQNSKVWFNNKGYVAMVSYMNIMNNLVLRANLPKDVDINKFGITVVNHPVNRTRAQLAEFAITNNWIDVLIAIAVIFALSSIPASFVLFLIQERVCGSKHLQFVSGVNPVVYWVGNFTWDMFNYILACTICIIIFLAFQVRAYVSPDNIPCLIALLLLYGWSITSLMYPASFWFSVPSTAYVGLQCANLFVGFISTIATFILEMLALQGDTELHEINEILRKVFLIFPQYCLGRGLIDMTRNQIIADAFAVFGEDKFENPFKWDLVGRNLFCLGIQGCIYFAFTLLFEYGFFVKKLPCFKSRDIRELYKAVPDEDIDVARERKRVMTGDAQGDTLTVEGLTKVYKRIVKKNHKAVDNICVGVHQAECFGLLGVNGAGKTSTFKMLTGDVPVSKGDAHLAGHSILNEMTSVHQNLGYCPQFDALCPLLTGKEHLQLYARLRGVPEKEVKVVAAWGIQKLGLLRYANKNAGDYSGGNKRKLSTAIALVGNPPVIFLDEPTTGMDPKARRFLWNCIANVMRDGRSVVLTSHSMEECEALCSRIAIMVNGVFKCLGSVQHLKNRFGNGYTVILRVSGEKPDMSPVMDFFTNTFPACKLNEQHHNMLQYQIAFDEISLSKIFGAIESVRQQYNIEDYSVSQTTLDQVFINFASKQNSERTDDDITIDTLTVDIERREPRQGDAIENEDPGARYLNMGEDVSITGMMYSPGDSRNSSFRSDKALFSSC